jgi:hypothetical protein
VKVVAIAVVLSALPISVLSYTMDGPTPAPERDWEFNITIINSFQCPYASEILGLDYVDGENAVTFASNLDDLLYTCSADDGTYIEELALDFAGNAHPFGLCYDADGDVYLNDFSGQDINWTDYSSWYDYPNPSSNKGSGLDFDGDYIWETYWTDGVYRFLPDGTGVEYFPISEVAAQMSGLAVFPLEGNLGIMIAAHGQYDFWFYEFDGSSVNYLGSVPCPLTPSQSQGLTYAAERGTFFWSYFIGDEDWIAELDINIEGGGGGGETAVAPTSMGAIKAAFR